MRTAGSRAPERCNRLVQAQRIIPDEKTLGDVQLRFFAALTPTSAERQYGPFTLASETPIRLTARQVRVLIEEVRATSWRVGTIRLGGVPSSRR